MLTALLRLAITGYRLHYLMLGCQPHLPIDSYFPTIRGMKKTIVLAITLPSYVNDCGKPLKRLKCSPQQRWWDRSGTLIGKLIPFHWSQVTWSWLKPMPTGGGGKWRISGRRNCTKWSARLQKVSLPTSWITSGQDAQSPPLKWTFFLITLPEGTHPCMVVQAKQARCTNTILEGQTLERSETEEAPQSANCPLLVQHQTGETPLGLVHRKLCAFMQMFPRASWIDIGWKVWCRGIGGV